VSPRIEGYNIDISENEAVLILGLDLELDSGFGHFEILNGSLDLNAINLTFFSCSITRSYAILNNISIGDTLDLDNGYLLNVSGIINPYNKGFFGNVIIISLETARIIYKMEDQTCNKLNIMVKDISEINIIIEGLESMYPGLYISSPKATLVENLSLVLKTTFNILLIISLISIILTAYKNFFSYLDSFRDRILEFGVYRTIGYSKKQILKINLYEVLINTVIGSLIGIVLGYFMVEITLRITKILFDIWMPGMIRDTLRINYNPIFSLYAALIGFIISIISALYPVIKYSKLEINDILKFDKEKNKQNSILNKLYKKKYILLLIIFFFLTTSLIFSLHNIIPIYLKNIIFIIFIFINLVFSSIVGIFLLKNNKYFIYFFRLLNRFKLKIVSINLKRKVAKNILVLSIIFLGFFSFMLINSFINKLSYNFTKKIEIPNSTDILLFSTSPIYPQQFIPSLELISGIKNASGIGFHSETENIDGASSQILYINPNKIMETITFNFIEGSDGNVQLLSENNSVIISNLLSKSNDLHLGDNLSINNKSYQIVGVIDDIFTFWSVSIESSNFVIFSYSKYEILYNTTPTVNSILIKSSINPKETANNLENNFPGMICIIVADIYSNAQSNLIFIDILSNTLISISGGLIIMGTLFIVVLNIRGRVNEIGIYRMLGMKKSEIKKVIMTEYFFLISICLFISSFFNVFSIFSLFFLYDFYYAITQLIFYLPLLCIDILLFGIIIYITDLIFIYVYLTRKLNVKLISLFNKNIY
ncbi:MAG: FtsX-like permease family protein, partial [Candidatus Lokiarchaeota archaeon]|nr:FtsX-like permease family protein [Candidatus Lokiarchaeota archaeon]